MTSQIDIPPTLLGQLNMSYRSKFFGYDMFDLPVGRERAFISTYQLLGYMREGQLVQLGSRGEASVTSLDAALVGGRAPELEQALEDDAIAWYQAAAYAYNNGLMRRETAALALIQ